MMLRPIARAETRRLLRDRTFRWALLVLGLATVLALANGLLHVQGERARIAALEVDEAERFATLARDLGTGNYKKTDWADLSRPAPVAVTLGARNVILKPGSLGLLTAGAQGVLPTAVRASMIRDPFRARLDAIENPRHLLLGTFDFVFVVVTLFPLLILALIYDLVSGEHERGTLPLLLAAPIPFERLLLVRIAVRSAAIVLVAAGLVAAAAVAAALAGGTTADVAMRGGATMLVVVGYASFWFVLGLAVERLRRSSHTNALLCLGAWLAVVVVLPASLNIAMATLEPPPSRLEMLAATRDAQIDAARKKTEALAAYYEDHPGLGGSKGDLSDFWINWVTQVRLVDQAVAPIEARFDERLARRRQFVRRTEVLSPAVVTESLLTDLAGAGAERHEAFAVHAREFDRVYRSFFDERVLARAPFTLRDVDAVPKFVMDEPSSAGTVLGPVARGLLLLLLPTLLLAVLAGRRISRVRWIERKPR